MAADVLINSKRCTLDSSAVLASTYDQHRGLPTTQSIPHGLKPYFIIVRKKMNDRAGSKRPSHSFVDEQSDHTVGSPWKSKRPIHPDSPRVERRG